MRDRRFEEMDLFLQQRGWPSLRLMVRSGMESFEDAQIVFAQFGLRFRGGLEPG